MDAISSLSDLPQFDDCLICVIDKNRKILYWSKNGERITGYNEKEILNEPIDLLFPKHEVETDLPRKILESSAKQGRVTNLGWRKTKDGRLFWSKWIVKAIQKNGETSAYTNVIRNLTEQKRKNTILKNSLKLAKVGAWNIDLTSSPVSFNLMEGSGDLLSINNNTSSITIKNALEYVDPQYQTKLLRGVVRLVKRECDELKMTLKTSTPQAKWWCYLKAQAEYYNGKCINIYGSFQDIHEERTTQINVEEREDLFRNTFDRSAMGMALVGLNGEWLKVNNAMCELVGYTEKEMLNITFQDITHPDDLQNDLDHLAKLESGEIENYQIEKRYYHKEGYIVPVLLSVSRYASKNNTTQYYFSQITDLREIKEAQSEVADKVKKLRTTNEELQRFAYVSAHHFSEPLNTIESYNNIIKKKLTPKEYSKNRQYFSFISFSINRLKALLRGLLRMYNLNRKVSKLQTFEPSLSFENVTKDLRKEIEKRKAQISSNCSIETIFGYKPEFNIILHNLIENALKFSDSRVTISFNGQEKEDEWIFSVEDNGCGIDEKYLDKVFLLYEKLDSSDSSSLGVGLTLSKKLVELHGGEMWILSRKNQGTKVYFTISKNLSNDGTTKSNTN